MTAPRKVAVRTTSDDAKIIHVIALPTDGSSTAAIGDSYKLARCVQPSAPPRKSPSSCATPPPPWLHLIVLVGFDGFVDTILHVVAQRETAAKYTRMTAMREFAAKIEEAAGQSANFEFVAQMVKLGGNGPIMANALGSYGTPNNLHWQHWCAESASGLR
jgi:hypothetical protein